MGLRNPYAFANWKRKQRNGGNPRPTVARKVARVALPGGGFDLVVQLPEVVSGWHEWPDGGPRLSELRRLHREGTRNEVTKAAHSEGFRLDAKLGLCVGLRDACQSIGLVRIAPDNLDLDSLVHTMHHRRDGVYDAMAGYKLDKNGRAVWHGQYIDNDHKAGAMGCSVNQIKDGDLYGLQIILRLAE